MNEFLEELNADERKSRSRLLSRHSVRLLLLFFMIVISAAYIGDLLFGRNSYSTILYLEQQKDTLTQDIESLKIQNAKYQKEYFELKKIGGDE